MQGGSTITQQYVKNTYTTGERDIARKLREALIATRLERQLTKDEILFRYLNTVYFGDGAYGIGAAAESVLRQAGLRAHPVRGRAPGRGHRLARPLRAPGQRRGGRGPPPDRPAGHAGPGPDRPPPVPRRPPPAHLVRPARPGRRARPRRPGRRPGAAPRPTPTSWTTSAGSWRSATATASSTGAACASRPRSTPGCRPRPRPPWPRPSTAPVPRWRCRWCRSSPSTGHVRALVGGRDFDASQVNLALGGSAGMQPGSSFKTFVLAAALEHGIDPETLLRRPGVRRVPGLRPDLHGQQLRLRGPRPDDPAGRHRSVGQHRLRPAHRPARARSRGRDGPAASACRPSTPRSPTACRWPSAPTRCRPSTWPRATPRWPTGASARTSPRSCGCSTAGATCSRTTPPPRARPVLEPGRRRHRLRRPAGRHPRRAPARPPTSAGPRRARPARPRTTGRPGSPGYTPAAVDRGVDGLRRLAPPAGGHQGPRLGPRRRLPGRRPGSATWPQALAGVPVVDFVEPGPLPDLVTGHGDRSRGRGPDAPAPPPAPDPFAASAGDPLPARRHPRRLRRPLHPRSGPLTGR